MSVRPKLAPGDLRGRAGRRAHRRAVHRAGRRRTSDRPVPPRRQAQVTSAFGEHVFRIDRYPVGAPGPDRVTLLAYLKRRLTDEADIGVLITGITDEIERVWERLAAYGWPLDYPRDMEEAE